MKRTTMHRPKLTRPLKPGVSGAGRMDNEGNGCKTKSSATKGEPWGEGQRLGPMCGRSTHLGGAGQPTTERKKVKGKLTGDE